MTPTKILIAKQAAARVEAAAAKSAAADRVNYSEYAINPTMGAAALGGGAIGTLLGAGGGLLSEALSDKKDKRYLRKAMLGALIGGGLGAGSGAIAQGTGMLRGIDVHPVIGSTLQSLFGTGENKQLPAEDNWLVARRSSARNSHTDAAIARRNADYRNAVSERSQRHERDQNQRRIALADATKNYRQVTSEPVQLGDWEPDELTRKAVADLHAKKQEFDKTTDPRIKKELGSQLRSMYDTFIFNAERKKPANGSWLGRVVAEMVRDNADADLQYADAAFNVDEQNTADTVANDMNRNYGKYLADVAAVDQERARYDQFKNRKR